MTPNAQLLSVEIDSALTAHLLTLALVSAEAVTFTLVVDVAGSVELEAESLRIFSGSCEGASIRAYLPSAPLRYEFEPPASHVTSIHPKRKFTRQSTAILAYRWN